MLATPAAARMTSAPLSLPSTCDAPPALNACFPIAALPPDVFRCILAYLPPSARLRAVSLVCRHWRRQVLLSETALTFVHSGDCRDLVRDGSSLGCGVRLNTLFCNFPNLRTLRLSACPRGPVVLPSTLRDLELWSAAWELISPLPALKSLALGKLRAKNASAIARCFTAAVTASLTSLMLAQEELGSDLVTLLAATHFPALSHLAFTLPRNRAPAWWPSFETFLRQHCTQLISLRLDQATVRRSRSSQITLLCALPLPRLHTLRILSVEDRIFSEDHASALVANAPNLKVFEAFTFELAWSAAQVVTRITSRSLPYDSWTAPLPRAYPRLTAVALLPDEKEVADGDFWRNLLASGFAHLFTEAPVMSAVMAGVLLPAFCTAATQLSTLHLTNGVLPCAALPRGRMPALRSLVLHLPHQGEPNSVQDTVLLIMHFMSVAPRLELVTAPFSGLTEADEHTLCELLAMLRARCISLRIVDYDVALDVATTRLTALHGWCTLALPPTDIGTTSLWN